MAQRGRPKKIDSQLDEAQKVVHQLYAEKRKKYAEERMQAMSALSDTQIKAIQETTEALRDFTQEFSEMFDIHTETARKLHAAFWSMHSSFDAKED